ncbi:hypothetical protein CCACVL1_16602 [Corchorus capsularis]|uniref:Uncharacterized protein n=1 Tax=Corchorus capsularis TaxID=210143 RepID=A0A1R3HW30_COCAP|nr:hypothetical protein CCACVL1_16602 [Corchorus capsularis]
MAIRTIHSKGASCEILKSKWDSE